VSAYPCPECGRPTAYRVFCGGREWVCGHCGADGDYPEGAAPRRAALLRTPEGRSALRAETDRELARLRERGGGA